MQAHTVYENEIDGALRDHYIEHMKYAKAHPDDFPYGFEVMWTIAECVADEIFDRYNISDKEMAPIEDYCNQKSAMHYSTFIQVLWTMGFETPGVTRSTLTNLNIEVDRRKNGL